VIVHADDFGNVPGSALGGDGHCLPPSRSLMERQIAG
jgi:hypothetical protein